MSLLVRDALKMAESQLERSGRSDAKLDAELIFRYLFQVDKMGLFKLWSQELDDAQFDQYFELIDIRAGGKPLQYITGEQSFMGYTFEVNESVLIPRQDTEILVSEAVSPLQQAAEKNHAVLDLCCGSGAVGISIACLCSNVKVTASDISEGAVSLARRNAKKLGAERKMTFTSGDLFRPFKKGFLISKFDMIVSNPPYIKSHMISTLQPEIKDHEPHLALDGGPEGLDFYRRIIAEAPKHLKKGGMLLLEIGWDQADAVRQLAQGIFGEVRIVKDLAGHDRVAVLVMESR